MAKIGAHYFHACTRGAERAGLDRETLLNAAGLTAEQVDQPGWRGSVESMSLLVRAIWAALDDEHMGYTARPVRSGSFAMMTELAIGADSVLDALVKGVSFYRLVTDAIETRLDTKSDTVILTVAFRQPELDPDNYFKEFWMIIWHRFACWLAGGIVPIGLAEIGYSRPIAYFDEFSHLFPAKHLFDRPACCLHFDRTPLLSSIVPTKADRTAMVARAPLDFMTIPGSDHSLSRRVQMLITPRAGNSFLPLDLSEISAALGLHPVALSRQLRHEGMSVRRIIETIRKDRAISRLTREGWTVDAIAADLGYAEARSFTRAFRGWTGVSPLRYRFLARRDK